MRSISWWFVGSFVLFLCCPASEGRGGGVVGIERGLVKVQTIDRDGHMRSGSGFVIGIEGVIAHVATAAHVVEGADVEVIFWTDRNRPREAEVIAMDTNNDLAALKVWPVPLGVVPIPLELDAGARRGEHLQVLGFPRRSLTPISTFGWMSGWKGLRILVDAAADSGSSGGPLLRGGRALGLITGIEGHLTQAVPSTVLGPTLDGWGVRQSTPRVDTTAWRPPPSVPTGTSGRCQGEIVVRRGALRPVSSVPSRNAPSTGKVPEGVMVQLVQKGFGEGSVWYLIDYNVPGGRGRGWIPGDQVKLLSDCSL